MTLFSRLKSDNKAIWDSFVNHKFVIQLANGTLENSSFKYYLGQDYLFLIHFARAYALAAYKSGNLVEIKQAVIGLNAIIDFEMELHVKFCADWDLSEDEMEVLPEAFETMAYTRYVLEKGLSGDLLDLHVALAPCIIGYAEIGNSFKSQIKNNPYGSWIEMYASDEYQALAKAEIRQLDNLMSTRGGEGRFKELSKIFNQSVRLEIDFWQMGLNAE
ncbi:MAG: thiaminase II [Pseudomonadota bacterium]|nr:thiaminase II [Pseudomonadota bacterium]